MRAAVAIAVVTLLAVAATAIPSNTIRYTSGCDSSCVCTGSSFDAVETFAGTREVCTQGGSVVPNATGIQCRAGSEVCGNLNTYSDSSCTGTIASTSTVVCNKCQSIGDVFYKYTCTQGSSDLMLNFGCDQTCGSCVLTTGGAANCSGSGTTYSKATTATQCNVFAITAHTGSMCSSMIKPASVLYKQGCLGTTGVKIECGGNSASSAAVSFAAVALVAILSVVA
jgi:hypothetical protein